MLDVLNPPQRDAVLHGEGPLLILAGAGSGKTRVITHRIAHLVRAAGVAPDAILAVTFTNKAAQEMRERVEKLLGYSAGRIHLGTFHAICARLIRRHADALGFKASFSIYDSADQLALVKQVMKDLNVNAERFVPAAVHAAIGRFKQDLLDPKQVVVDGRDVFAQVAARVYESYQIKLKEANALDFDDLLNFAVRLLQEDAALRARYNEAWEYILVDEYQDTNKAQYAFLRLLTERRHNICVVGDDDQSIYRWRGANLQNILDFEKDFQGARVIKLEQNYRSSENILSVAHNVISRNVGRKAKKLWTDAEAGERTIVYAAETEKREAQFVADEIAALVSHQGLSFGDIAIFYRTNAQSRPFESQFVLSNIPYTIVGGLRFYERKEIKDILAYLRVLLNPGDEISLQRIINVPRRGIGDETVGKIRGVSLQRRLPFWEAMREAMRLKALSIAAAGRVGDFLELVGSLRETASTMTLAQLVPMVIEKTGYWAMLNAEGTEEAKDRIENLQGLVNEVVEFARVYGEDATLDNFLERASLASDVDEFSESRERVALMTVHAAKGLEFPAVFLTGMEEQLFPHSRAMDAPEDIEEERRLAYVGITRARRRLYLTLARSRMVFGQTKATRPSRFLGDVSPSYLDDRSAIPFRAAGPSGGFRFGARQLGATRFGSGEEAFDGDGEPSYEPTYDAETGEAASPFQPGMKVFHPSFGVGKIVSIVGQGEEAKVTVLFPGAPMKKIMARFLQPVN
ncbi:MAG: ATP-dependent DNA helicase PcrA [Myxococcales bacterium]|nr:MAG: ATP-dependent DNA helicase PcrA [Myxococcales bacterium]